MFSRRYLSGFAPADQPFSILLLDRTGFLMRRWLCLVPALCSPLLGVIVDRIAITVGNKGITESAIVLRIRLTAFENDESPDFSLASRKATADRLVDQRIVEREMDVGHYTRLGDSER